MAAQYLSYTHIKAFEWGKLDDRDQHTSLRPSSSAYTATPLSISNDIKIGSGTHYTPSDSSPETAFSPSFFSTASNSRIRTVSANGRGVGDNDPPDTPLTP
ncbi:hypothetical protein GLOTRDRAFT_129268 [Gloeophyllum trabeum ATCC 11539]|uniref:Uncharacterized protein n=1 Tax=Gloeophyllum trabeum (strain ATCC 11539 / FP-39264 / Madison 617) TaxID=670483 RepID=S7Q656_GLOTA|nr:uncharacterized protein GLOTRDRAFT_129268 [Gloeophyllum trabeum ATCC 11539]EPQ54958.1 hypothetical protein GLOTRDRAFT_129268 [Gloeophyllum trabeum ATCC 11539]